MAASDIYKSLISFGVSGNPITKLFGGGGKEAKAAARSEDMARQAQEIIDILESFGSQLVPGSDEWNQLQAIGSDLISRSAEGPFAVDALGGQVLDQQPAARALGQKLVGQQQQRIAGGGAATPAEARTNQQISGLREAAAPSSYEQDLLDALSGSEINTPIGEVFRNQINRAASPTIDDSVFRNALKLVEDRVNQDAAGRGTLGSGLRLEQMGRAGVDAALGEASRQDKLRSEAYNNATGLYDSSQNIRNRGIGLESDLVNLQLGRESNLTNLLARQGATSTANSRALLDNRADQAYAGRLDQQDQDASFQNQLGQLIGLGAGTVFGPAGAAIGSQIGKAVTGNGAPSNASQLLAMRQAQPQVASQGGIPGLSLNPSSQYNPDLELLKKYLTGGG